MVYETLHDIRHFAPQIEKAVKYGGGGYALDDVIDEIERGDAQLWVRDEGLIITQVAREPNGLYLIFWIAAGDLDDVLSLTHEIYSWGREQGCVRAIFRGRRGWRKVLESEGWGVNRHLVTYEKDLWADE